MKYDLEIVLAVSAQGKYAKRLQNFKKYGLQNIGDHTVRLSLLVGTEEIKDVSSGWNEKLDVRIITCNLDHAAAKMHDFYANYSLEDIQQTKWIMRVDDDSISILNPLINLLNYLDYNDPIYFVTHLMQGEINVEKQILQNVNSRYKDETLWHEVECCIVSNCCFKRILQNEFTLNILKLRAVIEKGYTDICLTACARECGVYPSPFYYISHYENIYHFLSGNVFHIHYVSEDVNSNAFKIAVNDRSKCHLINNSCVFCEKDLNNKLQKKNLLFLRSNGIIDVNLPNLNFWTFDDHSSELNLYNSHYELEFTFELKDKLNYYTMTKFKKEGLENNFFIENKSSFFM